MKTPVKSKPSYHHGNLRQALLEEAFQRARADGPEAIGLRAIARQVGVSSTAVYRHFPDQVALFFAVKKLIAEELADFIEQQLATVQPRPDAALENGLDQIRAVCKGYIQFALDQPGLFRTACNSEVIKATKTEQLATNKPFMLLQTGFQPLIQAGYITAEHEMTAELAVWASAHGLAVLLLDSPLHDLPLPQRQAVIDQTIDGALRGIKESLSI